MMRLSRGQHMEDHVACKGPAFHGTAGTVNGNIPVHAGILRETNGFSVQFSKIVAYANNHWVSRSDALVPKSSKPKSPIHSSGIVSYQPSPTHSSKYHAWEDKELQKLPNIKKYIPTAKLIRASKPHSHQAVQGHFISTISNSPRS